MNENSTLNLPNYLAIGHIAQDLLPDGSYRPGGTVSFAALTAKGLDWQAGIVTAAPLEVQQLPIFAEIAMAGQTTAAVTVYENIYTPAGRIQYLRSIAPGLTAQDVPSTWLESAQIVHLGPIAQEITPDLLKLFPKALIGVTPQGWMRAWDAKTQRVYPTMWQSASEILPQVDVLVLSEEDLPAGIAGVEVLQGYVAKCSLVALTRDEKGCTIYQKGQSWDVAAFAAQPVDLTGAGDVFATAFFIRYRETGNALEAARFANAAAACNIEKPGLKGTPTLSEVTARLQTSDK